MQEDIHLPVNGLVLQETRFSGNCWSFQGTDRGGVDPFRYNPI